MKKLLYVLSAAGLMFASCTTTQMVEFGKEVETTYVPESPEEEAQFNEQNMNNLLIQEELKVQDVSSTVVYVERPVYVPEDKKSSTDVKHLSGTAAVNDSTKIATKTPENYKNGAFYYQYDEGFVFEIYAQPLHLTDIVLEDGEIVIGTPLLSEDETVWELTAGVAKNPDTGADIQHLFVKPAYSKLDSSLIIITDRRVYHFRLRSFSDTHMAMVKFTYPNTKNVWAKKQDSSSGRSFESDYIRTTNTDLLSFDYLIKYSNFKKPEFLPKRVYDDGQCTYIQVDEIVLQKKLPVLFNENNEIVNYSVKENVFVVPRLINKMTLRLGKEKVTIEKKITKTNNAQEK